MRWCLSILLILSFVSMGSAQYNSTYEIALQRIQEAEASGATYLDLSSLALTELPPEIGNLSNLQSLYLHNNQLSSLPSAIGNLSNLQVLGLSYNQLSSLPSEIGNLSNLQGLGLQSNQLSSLPSEIGNLTDLCYLDILDNPFPSIPFEIHPLKSLGTHENCAAGGVLLLDNALLDTLPDAVVDRGTSAILDYLENEALWHLRRLMAGGASAIAFVLLGILGWRWKNRRGKRKRKHSL